jgi:hypothetical protein
MLTDTQSREINHLVLQLSADLTVAPDFIVEAIREDESVNALVYRWLTRGGVEYRSILDLLNGMF